MGSNQSAPDDVKFSVDPNGNITRENRSPKTSEPDGVVIRETPGPKIHESPVSISSETPSPKIHESPVSISSETPSPKTPEPASNINLETKSQKIPVSAGDVTSVKRYSYRPIFGDMERDLTLCYQRNKDQQLNCAEQYREYKKFVDTRSGQVLKKSMNMTSVLVIITCLLLHIASVSCFGAMSIDLGGEWMKVGLVAPSVQMDIVLNAQSQRKTPMAIAFSNGERFIGDPALDIASKYPERTYTHFLDLVGKSVDHPSVEHYKRRFPYANITSHEPNSTSILLNHPEGPKYTPLELVAMMIQHAHDQVISRLSNTEPAYDVVITVPPFFEAQERKVIEQAAKLAGLNALRLTNVNSAFALSYGIFRHKDYHPESSDPSNRTSILFFDQGALHTSATLADYHLVEQFDEATGLSKNESLPTITVRAQVFDRYLGGFDMQLRLRDYLVKAFAKLNNIDEQRIMQRGKSAAKLLNESGRVKKVLSANTDYLVRVENVIDDKDMRLPISRQEFEEMNKDYLEDRVTSLLDKLFEMPDVSRSDPLESVIIVGGNTRTPKIQQVLLDYFKLETLGKSINADEGAALSALYQAASLGRGFRVKKFMLEEFGEERRRYDPTREVTLNETSSLNASAVTDQTILLESPIATNSSSSPPQEDPNLVYSELELQRIGQRLEHLRHRDQMRFERLYLRNLLESLLSEASEKEEKSQLFFETREWLEDGPEQERENVTLLALKISTIQELMHPTTTQAPPVLIDEL